MTRTRKRRRLERLDLHLKALFEAHARATPAHLLATFDQLDPRCEARDVQSLAAIAG